MRFHSTPKSALKGEITKLAIIECIVSVAIYIALGIYIGSFRYLAAAIVAAPLMLFRTKFSSDWGLKVHGRFISNGEALLDAESLLAQVSGFVLIVLIAPIAGLVIRVLSILYWLIRKPLYTLSEMPNNWVRQSLCTDFFHVPEILPLEATQGEKKVVPTFNEAWELVIMKEAPGEKILGLLVVLPALLIGYIPSLIYRVSFKATAVAYLPFIWVAHATIRNPMAADVRLKRITKGELEKVRRKLSWIIIATLTAKFGFLVGLVDWSRIEEKFPSKRLVQSVVVPDGWPWWQITLGADALVTVLLLFFADAALSRLNTKQLWREQTVLGTVSTVSFLRAALSIVTISHFLRIALVALAPGPLHRLLAG